MIACLEKISQRLVPVEENAMKLEFLEVQGVGRVRVLDINPTSFLLTGQGPDTKRVIMTFLTQTDEEINEDITSAYQNTALVASLLLTMALPGEVVEPSEGNLWGSNAGVAAQVHGLLLGTCAVACVGPWVYCPK